ncbi:unnamed protein product [Amaranthus hypochondriacus]
MFSLSPSSILNPISLSPSIIFHTQTHLFNGNPVSMTSPTKQLLLTKNQKPNSSISKNPVTEEQNKEDEEQFQVLTATSSEYNNIVILESRNSKVLLLDDSGNVHSILYKHQKWTNSYWDEFSSFPAIIPQGPVAIFGLGGGTIAHQLLEFWPCLNIDGWELDEILIDQARLFFGLFELESRNKDSCSGDGFLRVCIGDALDTSSRANVNGGYAGIIVDLFSNAEVLPQLEVAQTWVEMKEKLMVNGRIMVNCGSAKGSDNGMGERGWEVNLTIKALCRAFGGQFVNWKKMPENEGGNYMAFTGTLPDFDSWSASVPEKLGSSVKLWRPCQL